MKYLHESCQEIYDQAIYSLMYCFKWDSSEYFLNADRNLIWRLIYFDSDSICIYSNVQLIEVHLTLYANDKYSKPAVHEHIILVWEFKVFIGVSPLFYCMAFCEC